jgi:hypothetical protein
MDRVPACQNWESVRRRPSIGRPATNRPAILPSHHSERRKGWRAIRIGPCPCPTGQRSWDCPSPCEQGLGRLGPWDIGVAVRCMVFLQWKPELHAAGGGGSSGGGLPHLLIGTPGLFLCDELAKVDLVGRYATAPARRVQRRFPTAPVDLAAGRADHFPVWTGAAYGTRAKSCPRRAGVRQRLGANAPVAGTVSTRPHVPRSGLGQAEPLGQLGGDLPDGAPWGSLVAVPGGRRLPQVIRSPVRHQDGDGDDRIRGGLVDGGGGGGARGSSASSWATIAA